MKIQNFPIADKSGLRTHLDWALAYASCGLHVFPLHSMHNGRCTCGRDCGRDAAKQPRVKGGFKAATTDDARSKRGGANGLMRTSELPPAPYRGLWSSMLMGPKLSLRFNS